MTDFVNIFAEYDALSWPLRFEGTLQFTSQVRGGVPADPDKASGWIKSKVEASDETIKNLIEQTKAELGISEEEAILNIDKFKTLNMFKRDETGLYIEGRQLKAAIKEAAVVALSANKIPNRGWGAELRLSTPLPSPTGWTTMGDVKEGDMLLDEQGDPCTITAVYDNDPHKAYRLLFSDGSTLVAGENHLWVTLTYQDRKVISKAKSGLDGWASKEPINTTEIISTLKQWGENNHCIPTTLPLNLPNAELPIEPWLFGYWLGDGDSNGGVITVGSEDYDYLASKVPLSFDYEFRVGFAGRYGVNGMRPLLIYMGVLHNKHIPQMYLRASELQRRALLAGLLDSDGYIDNDTGKVEFFNTNEVLVDGVMELARSLGMKPTKHAKSLTAAKDSRIRKPGHRVTFRPHVPPFQMPRKNARFKPMGAQKNRNLHRIIVGYEELPPEPMRCITVDSPNSLYLAGEAMIPTHNTRKSLRPFLAEHMMVEELRLYLKVDGDNIQEPSGVEQSFVHTYQGSSIKNEEYVYQPALDFTLVTDWEFTRRDYGILFNTGGRQGLGASRSQGYGQYTITRFDQTLGTPIPEQ